MKLWYVVLYIKHKIQPPQPRAPPAPPWPPSLSRNVTPPQGAATKWPEQQQHNPIPTDDKPQHHPSNAPTPTPPVQAKHLETLLAHLVPDNAPGGHTVQPSRHQHHHTKDTLQPQRRPQRQTRTTTKGTAANTTNHQHSAPQTHKPEPMNLGIPNEIQPLARFVYLVNLHEHKWIYSCQCIHIYCEWTKKSVYI